MNKLQSVIIGLKKLIPIGIKKPIKSVINYIYYLIAELLPLIRNLFRIRKLNLDNSIKMEIQNTLVKTVYLKSYNKDKKTVNIARNQVRFDSIDRVRSLFKELFVEQPYYFKTSNTEPKIIDCGSHIGVSIVFFKMLYPNAKIIGFEPNKYAYKLLEKTLDLNKLSDITIHNKALMNYDGEVDIFINQSNKRDVATSTIEERVTNGTKYTVQSTKLSHYINDTIDFIKIDIEGAELVVLEELEKKQKLKYIKQMTIEYHHHIDEHKDDLSILLTLLENAGFGYHFDSQFSHPYNPYSFQDIMIFAYNKSLIN